MDKTKENLWATSWIPSPASSPSRVVSGCSESPLSCRPKNYNV